MINWHPIEPIMYACIRKNIHCLRKTANHISRGELGRAQWNHLIKETFQCSMSFLYPDEQEHFVVCSPSAASRWLVGRRRDCKPWATTFDEIPLTSIFLKFSMTHFYLSQIPLSMNTLSLPSLSNTTLNVCCITFASLSKAMLVWHKYVSRKDNQ